MRVFLSYAHDDQAAADQVESALATAGADVFRYSESILAGDRWIARISKAIAQCTHLVLLWSKSAAGSQWVELEWGAALDLKKRVIVVLVDGDRPPELLTSLQAIDLRKPDAISRLLDGVRSTHHPVGQSDETASVPQALDQVNSPNQAKALEAGPRTLSRHLPHPWRETVRVIMAIVTVVLVLVFVCHTRSVDVHVDVVIRGTIRDQDGRPVDAARVQVVGFPGEVATDDTGTYSLKVSGARMGEPIRISARCLAAACNQEFETTVSNGPADFKVVRDVGAIRKEIERALRSQQFDLAVKLLSQLSDTPLREEGQLVFDYSLRNGRFDLAQSAATRCWQGDELARRLKDIQQERLKHPPQKEEKR